MAEAIWAVLQEGLSLSQVPTFTFTDITLTFPLECKKRRINFQAARKFDIPYPTFVLYANRVHNMLGPTPLGVSEMRPKVDEVLMKAE